MTRAAVLLALLCAAPAAAAAEDTILIGLERTPCFGTCPVYSVTIRGDGRVTYTGTQHVRVSGTQQWTIDAQRVRALAADMERAGFFEMKDEYTAPATDLPSVYVTLTVGSRSKRIRDYLGGPPALKEIEARIDRESGARGYVFVSAAAVGNLQKKGWRADSDEGRSWMRRALLSGDVEVVRALLTAGYNARAADDNGVTLVMMAASSGDAETVRAVLAAGGDPTARDKGGRNAADRARDGLADPPVPGRGRPVVESTGKPRDFALILKLLTDE